MDTQSQNLQGQLLIAVVQAQDVDNAQSALAKIGISLARLPSVGGFLGRRNATLLIGIPEDRKEQALDALHQSCRQRIEFIAVPLESAPLPLPAPTPITIGGATIFALEVEHYEEI
ncbi:MAG TPA: cyclic-di-AMP receptor [Anaerolineaceae bacterium]